MLNKLRKFFKNQRNIDDIKIQNGMNFFSNMQLNLNNIKLIEHTYFKVFSQNGEDGIIQYLLKSLRVENPKFVEIGTEDYSESNTRYLYETKHGNGLIIDGCKNLEKKIQGFLPLYKGNLKIYNDLISSDSIIKILNQFNFLNNLDLFSIDIDGVDYWVMKKLPDKISKIFVAEYNPYFGSNLEITVPNIKNFARGKYHYSNLCYGSSLMAIINLLKKKGFTFVGVNDLKNNAFFVQDEYIDLISLNLPIISKLEAYTNANYREGRNKENSLNYLDPKNVLKKISDCCVIDLKDNSEKLIRQLKIIP